MIWFTISRFCQASTYVPLVDRAYFLNQWEQSTFIYISCTVYDMVVLKNFDSILWSIYHRLHVKWRRLAVITIVAKLDISDVCAILDDTSDMWWHLVLIDGQVGSCNLFIYNMLQCSFSIFWLYCDLTKLTQR